MCVGVGVGVLGGGRDYNFEIFPLFFHFLQTPFEEFLQGHTQRKTFSGLFIH